MESRLEAGFANYCVKEILRAGECVGRIPVISGTAEYVELLTVTDFSYALAPGEEPQLKLTNPGFVYAPVVQGQEAGFAYVCLDGKAVGKVPLIYGKTVEIQEIKEPSLWEKLFKGGRT